MYRLLNLGRTENAVGGGLPIFTCKVLVLDDLPSQNCFYIKTITVSCYFYHTDYVLRHYTFIRRK